MPGGEPLSSHPRRKPTLHTQDSYRTAAPGASQADDFSYIVYLEQPGKFEVNSAKKMLERV